MVDKEPRKGEKDPINWKVVDEAIVLKLAEPDPEDPTRRRYDAIDEALSEAVISGIDVSGLSDYQLARLRNLMTKRIVDTKIVTLARLDNYNFLSTSERERMDGFLANLRGLNPIVTFESPSDYADLFTQQLAIQKPQATTVEYFDPTAPPRFDPNRPVQPGSIIDNILSKSPARYIGKPTTSAPERISTSPLPNTLRVMSSRS